MKIHFSYCVDRIGNLIKLDLSKFANALIPHAAHVVTYAEDLLHPKPWTFTVANAIDEVRFVPLEMTVDTPAELIHSKGVLPVSDKIFVPPCDQSAPEVEVLEMINLYEQMPANHTGRHEIEKALLSVGIKKSPVQLAEANLRSSALNDPLKTQDDQTAWVSHTKVYFSSYHEMTQE